MIYSTEDFFVLLGCEMTLYVGCCNYWIKISYVEEIETDELVFWLKRFCPNVITCTEFQNFNIVVQCLQSEEYKLLELEDSVYIQGQWKNSEDFLAKYITQLLQRFLVCDGILIVPAACVQIEKNKCILFIGDFWQGKTLSASKFAFYHSKQLICDNYVIIRNGIVFGCSEYISIPEFLVSQVSNSIYQPVMKKNNRVFFQRKESLSKRELVIDGLFIPYINQGMSELRAISKEESVWFLYQKLTRLLCGETVLFYGELASPCYLNDNNSRIVLNIVKELLERNSLIYVSSGIEDMPSLIGGYLWE